MTINVDFLNYKLRDINIPNSINFNSRMPNHIKIDPILPDQININVQFDFTVNANFTPINPNYNQYVFQNPIHITFDFENLDLSILDEPKKVEKVNWSKEGF